MNLVIFRNLTRKPARTVALTFLVIFLSFSVFGGSVMILSLRNGLNSLERRLGADIIVLPSSAKSHVNLEEMLLQGTPGYFYMNRSYLDEIKKLSGVEKVSAQYFLASANAGCCSVSTQIIGFDPDTDFCIQPWIKERYGNQLNFCDVVAGANITTPVGGTIRFYDVDCTVVARLDSTGTGMDTAVYANSKTVKKLIEVGAQKSLVQLENPDPDALISSVYIKVRDGYDVQAVADEINIHMRHVEAVKMKNMFNGISQSLSGISSTVMLLAIIVWILSFIIMIIAFSALINERKREFAVLRVMGASRKMLSRMILEESAVISLIGGVTGVLLTALVIFPFHTLIEEKLSLPFLMPSFGIVIPLAAATVITALIVAPLASSYAAFKLSSVDTGLILREGF